MRGPRSGVGGHRQARFAGALVARCAVDLGRERGDLCGPLSGLVEPLAFVLAFVLGGRVSAFVEGVAVENPGQQLDVGAVLQLVEADPEEIGVRVVVGSAL